MTQKGSSCCTPTSRHHLGLSQPELLTVWLFVFTTISMVHNVNGDYVVEVRTHSYSNPTNRCARCGANEGCCDNFNKQGTCFGEERCDTYFYYCLRTFGTSSSNFDCASVREGGTGIATLVQPDGAPIDFSQDEVLGLSNPLPMNGISDTWEGSQLSITALDYSEDALTAIDWFLFDIPTTLAPVGVESNPLTVDGIYGFATIELSLRVVCATNYYGPDCSEFCDSVSCTCPAGFTGEFCSINIDDCERVTCFGRGDCVDGVDSFQCICNSGYTGEQCETNINDCVEVDCSENGHCVDGVNTFTCVCISGFSGQLCEINMQFDDCVGVDCSGNGQCEDGVDSFTCLCNPGYTGRLCDTSINSCVGVDCSGNGSCVDEDNTITCICNSGFTGQLCETNIDYCIGVDCSGINGRCEDGVNSFTCVCDPGFTGQLCERKFDDCIGVDCSGNGRCEDGVNSFTCVCDPGFTGQLCERKFDDCIGVDCSGNGRCEDGVASFTCVCDPGFMGDLCNQSILLIEGDTTNRSNGTVAPGSNSVIVDEVVLGAVGGSVLLVFVLLVMMMIPLCILIKLRTKVTEATVSEQNESGVNEDLELRNGIALKALTDSRIPHVPHLTTGNEADSEDYENVVEDNESVVDEDYENEANENEVESLYDKVI